MFYNDKKKRHWIIFYSKIHLAIYQQLKENRIHNYVNF